MGAFFRTIHRPIRRLLTNDVTKARHPCNGHTPRQQHSPCFSTMSGNEGSNSELGLLNSMNEQVEPIHLESSDGLGLAWYTCGPTTYAPAHLGHARTYVCLDIIRRVLEARHQESQAISPPPLFVMNITDVDDKILAAAEESNQDPIELARFYESEFWKDLDALHCLRPHVVTRVSEYVESDIIPYIEALVQKGFAYQSDDGIYFDTRQFDEKLGRLTKYGKLAPPAVSRDFEPITSNQEVARPVASKRDRRDFALWKLKKPNEALSWSSPWGDGRPGWHIECSAMIDAVQKLFSETHRFSVHAGGKDLKFPHHTNEIAQAEAYLNSEWIPHWVHTGHLHIDGLKMSKSLKNFVAIRDFIQEFDGDSEFASPGDDFRLWCLGLSGSYRNSTTFSNDRMVEARNVRKKIVDFLVKASRRIEVNDAAARKWDSQDRAFMQAVNQLSLTGTSSLMNDLDGSAFLKSMVDIVELSMDRLAGTGPSEPLSFAVSTLRKMMRLVGFSDKSCDAAWVNVGRSHASTKGALGTIDALVEFRRKIRDLAIRNAKKAAPIEARLILDLCDDLRDNVMPSLGVEIHDDSTSSTWAYTLHKSAEPTSLSTIGNRLASTPKNVRFENYFKVGRYENEFSKYSEDGLPLTSADGTPVSKRLQKKLSKKREAYFKKLVPS